jgi:hypothetical protein
MDDNKNEKEEKKDNPNKNPYERLNCLNKPHEPHYHKHDIDEDKEEEEASLTHFLSLGTPPKYELS